MPDEPAVDSVKERAKAAAKAESPWALLFVLANVLAGTLVIMTSHWRRGSIIIAGALGLAALLRLALPKKMAGLLAVRSRWFDVLCLGGACAAIVVVTMIVPPSVPGR